MTDPDNESAIVPYQFTIDSAIKEWLAQKETRTGSAKTRQAYEDTIRQFRAFLASGNLGLLGNPIDIARVAALWANLAANTSPRAETAASTRQEHHRVA